MRTMPAEVRPERDAVLGSGRVLHGGQPELGQPAAIKVIVCVTLLGAAPHVGGQEALFPCRREPAEINELLQPLLAQRLRRRTGPYSAIKLLLKPKSTQLCFHILVTDLALVAPGPAGGGPGILS